MKRKYVLKNKRRFRIFMVLITLLIISTGFIVNAGTVQAKISHETIRIEKGDTLWEIASRYGGNYDLRNYIYKIKKLNSLEGDMIFEGQMIYLP